MEIHNMIKNYDVILMTREQLLYEDKNEIQALFQIDFERIIFDEIHEIINQYL